MGNPWRHKESDTGVQLSTNKHAVSGNSSLSLTEGTGAGGVIISGGEGSGKRVHAGGRPLGSAPTPGEAVLWAPHCDSS